MQRGGRNVPGCASVCLAQQPDTSLTKRGKKLCNLHSTVTREESGDCADQTQELWTALLNTRQAPTR